MSGFAIPNLQVKHLHSPNLSGAPVTDRNPRAIPGSRFRYEYSQSNQSHVLIRFLQEFTRIKLYLVKLEQGLISPQNERTTRCGKERLVSKELLYSHRQAQTQKKKLKYHLAYMVMLAPYGQCVRVLSRR